jgi:hypothetical protein
MKIFVYGEPSSSDQKIELLLRLIFSSVPGDGGKSDIATDIFDQVKKQPEAVTLVGIKGAGITPSTHVSRGRIVIPVQAHALNRSRGEGDSEAHTLLVGDLEQDATALAALHSKSVCGPGVLHCDSALRLRDVACTLLDKHKGKRIEGAPAIA